MFRRTARFGVVISLVLVASTQAWSAVRSTSPPRGEAVRNTTITRPANGAVTIRQLLLGRLDWSLRVSRALNALEQPAASDAGGGNGTWTIIDEPDPAGRSDEKGGSGERPNPIYDGGEPEGGAEEPGEVPLRDATSSG